MRFVLDAGAYADYTVNVGRAMGYSAEGVYEIPNVYCESYAVYTNKIPTTAMRGFGYAESNWVLEQVFERAAKKLGIGAKTLSNYIAVKKVPTPQVIKLGKFVVHAWTETEIEHVRKLLPKIANGRKTRYKNKQSAVSAQRGGPMRA